MADADIAESSATTIGLGTMPELQREGLAKDHHTSRKRKLSNPLEDPLQIISDASRHSAYEPGRAQKPIPMHPPKRSVTQRFLDKFRGPRLNPHGSNSSQISIPEGPYDQQVYYNGISRRPTTWPCSRKWRKSIGEATKNVNKPRPERDLAKEAQDRAKASEDFNNQVIPNLEKMGLIAKSRRPGHRAALRK